MNKLISPDPNNVPCQIYAFRPVVHEKRILNKENDIPGLLLLIDFEKAFDSVSWSFIQNTLDFFNFWRFF